MSGLVKNNDKLPEGWSVATISDLVGKQGVFVDGDWVESKDQDPNGDVRLIQLADIGDGVYRDKSQRFLTQKKAIELGCTFLKKGDVLVARMPDPLGRACIFPGDVKKSVTVVDVAIVRPKDGGFDTRWLMYFINAPVFRNTVASMESGSTRKRISRKNLSKIPLPVPPFPVQKLIVSEIEKQFSRLDEAVAALKRVRAGLKRYKASVLKAAVEGKLTEEWRKLNPDVEPADKLLERIKKERSLRGAERRSKLKGKEDIASLLARKDNLPELPRGWVWATWERILAQEEGAFRRGPFGSTLKKSMFVESGYKVYEQYCPINDDPSFARYFITEEKYKEMEQFVVKARDFLISCSGTMGRITQVPDEYDEGVINQALLRVRINNNIINGVFFKMLFISPYFQKQIFDNSTGSAIQNVKGVNDLKAIPLPLPPLEEQKAIIEEIDRRMSVIHEIDKEIETNLKRAERLRQAILKKAFSGHLINADQNGNKMRVRTTFQRSIQRGAK